MISLRDVAITLTSAAAIFVPLELAWTGHAAWRRPHGWVDLAFLFGQAFLFFPAASAALSWASAPLGEFSALLPVRGAFAALPGAAQVLLAVMLGDLCAYWGHRLQHEWEPLWRFHAVHHTAEDVDWLAAFREHPLDGLYTQALVNLPALVFGLDWRAWAGVIAFRGLWATFLHTRARVPLGPLKWVLGSPEFHRAHHAPHPRVGHYANLAPYLDLMFGTHGPTAEPARTGIDAPHPTSWWGLVLWPLTRSRLSGGGAPGVGGESALPGSPAPHPPGSWRRQRGGCS